MESPLHSTRLKMQLISHSDLAFIHELLTRAEVDRFNALGVPNSFEETLSMIAPWIRDNQQEQIMNRTWFVEDVSRKAKIGLFGLKLSTPKYKRGEVWCKLHPAHWNFGYATETLNRIIDFGFTDCQLHRIHAGCAVDNYASIRVLEKVGMVREGRGREVLPLSSGWSDNFEYAILETDPRL